MADGTKGSNSGGTGPQGRPPVGTWKLSPPSLRAGGTRPIPSMPTDTPTSKAALDREAEAKLGGFRGVEARALARLNPPQRAQYAQLIRVLERHPLGRLGLCYLAIRGQLTGGIKSSEGKDLLATLGDLAARPLARGVVREELLDQVVKDLAAPTVIAQTKKGSRAITTTQIRLALRYPAEYARLIGGLASPGGQVKLASGRPWSRVAGTEREDDQEAIPARLLQGALASIRRPGQTRP